MIGKPDALRTCVTHGFSNNIETFTMVSDLRTSTFALGGLIGPSAFRYKSLIRPNLILKYEDRTCFKLRAPDG
nr:unnamed protein product [Callosobruchus chinensis]